MRRMVYLCIIIDEVNEVAEVITSLEVKDICHTVGKVPSITSQNSLTSLTSNK